MTTLNTNSPMDWPTFKTYEQLCLCVLDGSGSMGAIESGSGLIKADSVEKAVRELVERLAQSDAADQFLVGAVTFDQRVECPLLPTTVTEIDDSDLDLALLASHGGSTAIGDALDLAGQIADEFLQDEEDSIPRYVIILLMSDGQSNQGSDPIDVARKLRATFAQMKPHGPELTIAAAAYGDDADNARLQTIASSDQFYRRVESGAELRDFFFSSISASMAGAEEVPTAE